MSSTPPTTTLYPALLAAMREFNPVVKNKQNPHLKNFYADLGAVLEAVTEPLANHGLLIVQRFGSDQGTPVLITEIVHAESGQTIASELPIICKDPTDPQKLGGAITYARRYSLVAILSLTAEDDDGNTASKPAPPRRRNDDDLAARKADAAPTAQPEAAQEPSPGIEAGAFESIMQDAAKLNSGGKPYAAVVDFLRQYRNDASEAQYERMQTFLKAVKPVPGGAPALPHAGHAG